MSYESHLRLLKGATPPLKRQALPFPPIPDLAPGESHELKARPGSAFRGERLFVSASADLPVLRFYQKHKRAGGSKRRGRLASQLWAIETLAHRKRTPLLVIDDIAITAPYGRDAIATDAAIPWGFFSPDMVGNRLELPPSAKEGDITIRVRNLEIGRVVRGNVAMLGVGP